MILALAMLIDAALGEPEVAWRRVPHPAVLMGRAVEALERRLNRGPKRAMGILAMAILVVGAAAIGWLLSQTTLTTIVAAAILLAQHSLVIHVKAVATALTQGLPEARQAVAMIVGRDTAEMDEHQVARAAIESAAENLSDGVIAPIFWFAVAGLPGMVVYKIVNTADSTVGYRTPRYETYGWAAARLDDVLNWIPARLTAALFLITAWTPAKGVAADARLHRSPNAGWPEAALARVLGVALSGPRSYEGKMQDFPFVNAAGRRDANAADILAATGHLWRVWLATLALVVIMQTPPWLGLLALAVSGG